MDITHLIAAGAAAVFILVMLSATLAGPIRVGWQVPAVVSFAFLIFSLVPLFTIGPIGVWVVHTADLWGNQVWIDLLLAVGAAWLLLLPEMKRVGMTPLPWLLLTFCTGCIGLFAALARMMYLRENRSVVTRSVDSAA